MDQDDDVIGSPNEFFVPASKDHGHGQRKVLDSLKTDVKVLGEETYVALPDIEYVSNGSGCPPTIEQLKVLARDSSM
ncbi:MAG: hypothetical protein ACK2UO_02260 [Caldilineaceae bacterium]